MSRLTTSSSNLENAIRFQLCLLIRPRSATSLLILDDVHRAEREWKKHSLNEGLIYNPHLEDVEEIQFIKHSPCHSYINNGCPFRGSGQDKELKAWGKYWELHEKVTIYDWHHQPLRPLRSQITFWENQAHHGVVFVYLKYKANESDWLSSHQEQVCI